LPRGNLKASRKLPSFGHMEYAIWAQQPGKNVILNAVRIRIPWFHSL
jgi:hypothetical protein